MQSSTVLSRLGIFLLDKPISLSSNHALQRVKRLFKSNKAGHTGTLDPLATGMLPICFGAATKFTQYLLDEDKTYYVVADLGTTTTTGDLEGDVVLQRPIPKLSINDINVVLAEYRGDIQQVPPMYSALKHNGRPLYEYARQGIEIERPARAVTIMQLDIVKFAAESGKLTLSVKCSKGTYIRSLIYDIGESLGCGAVVTELRRTQVGDFLEESMITLDLLTELKESNPAGLDKFILPISSAFQHLPVVTLDEVNLKRLRQGQTVFIGEDPVDLAVVNSENKMFAGLVSVQEDQQLKVRKLLAVVE